MSILANARTQKRIGLLLLAALINVNAVADGDSVVVTPATFKCLQDMTAVRGFFVDNISGNLQGTLKVAQSPTGGVYPPGSVIQLIPNEVMIKHDPGFSPITHDWEFFELDVSKSGSTIRHRGFVDVQNRFNGNCFGCHAAAKPEFDMVCEENHGCGKLPIGRMTIKSLQKTDPRCKVEDASVGMRMTAWVVKLFTGL